MPERRIGIRELKSKLSECVRDVKDGQTIVVTERGRAVARLIPDATSVRERLAELRSAGGIQWSGRRLTRRNRSHGYAGAERSLISSARIASDCVLRRERSGEAACRGAGVA
jgi:prevent-host-death family protein